MMSFKMTSSIAKLSELAASCEQGGSQLMGVGRGVVRNDSCTASGNGSVEKVQIDIH
jgi:hypothetical protein